MGDALAVLGARHVLLVDVVDGEVAGDAGEQVDVGLADRLGEGDAVARLHVELFHGSLLPDAALDARLCDACGDVAAACTGLASGCAA